MLLNFYPASPEEICDHKRKGQKERYKVPLGGAWPPLIFLILIGRIPVLCPEFNIPPQLVLLDPVYLQPWHLAHPGVS